MKEKIIKLAKRYSVEILDYSTFRTSDHKQKYDLFLKRQDGTVQNYVSAYSIGKAGTKDNFKLDFEKFLKGLPFNKSNLKYSFKQK
jgi:hypothetical protein